MTVYMFPGQGAQCKGMGADFFSKYAKETSIANEILGYDVADLCNNDPENKLSNTQYTQPALFIVEALTFLEKQHSYEKPDYCIGHSLGEYSALFASGALSFDTGLQLVKKRGELMAQASGGSMLAVINLSSDRIEQILNGNNINTIDIANHNSPKQIVISGPQGDIQRANQLLSDEAMMCVPLNVSGAFHSRYMQDAANQFKQFINQFSFNSFNTKVIANSNVECYIQNSIIDNLVNQVTTPVRWCETISYLKGQGESEFIEIGPGNVLTRLMAQN